jgi:Mn2+/Fe2+ NRAMP family transporter
MSSTPAKRWLSKGLGRLGPGLITGAADDDPSGIATYSQAGAQFGIDMLWTQLFTYPLMVAVQLICARVGRVTGRGLAVNLRDISPAWAVQSMVLLLFVANTINIGADVGAIGAAGALVIGRGQVALTVAAALISLLLQIFVPYSRYQHYLKGLTLALFAYVAVVFTVHIDWLRIAGHIIFPRAPLTGDWVTTVVALFGTTISPYMFFWQASEEVEEMHMKHRRDLKHSRPGTGRRELGRIRTDTLFGMGFSNLIAFFIILSTATTLHESGITNVETSAQAAQALKPIAGQFASLLFTVGIIGTGFLATPVLAGASAYAAAEMFGWSESLEYPVDKAKGFYAVIACSMILALGILFLPLDPIKALFWSAVINGVISVPILGATMILASRRDEMGKFVATAPQRVFGWAATTVMAVAVIAMFVFA